MASANVSMDNGNNNDALSRSYSERSSDRNRESVGAGSRDYDGLKQQCDIAIHELQLLRRQNSETNRRCEHTMKEMEYYRNQHHAAMSQLEAAAQESSTLRSKYSELVSDKQRLDREISELRSNCCNQQDIISENGANEAFSNHYIATINKYEALKDDYESLRQQYDNIFASHTTAMDKLEITQEEVARLKQQIDEINKERNMVIRECNGLKHQCTQAIRQWDITLRERNELQEALKKAQQQHEEAMKQIDAAMSIRMKTSKDMKRLTEERNAAMQEYSLIMSERDTVHKEIEKLTEDLTQAYKKINVLETNAKEFVEEKKTLSYHIETLKREIASALNDRDKALKECNDFRERFGEFTAKEESQREAFKSRYDYPYARERDSKRSDLSQIQSTSIDLFTKCQKERMDNLDQANQEIERLRQCIDKQHAELQDALQEAEVSKRRRDWAFNERDKIVLERESIRTLCDRLRKERDRAVSDLAEALRDSDDIKRQKNETSKELKVLKEKMEVQLEKETRMLQLHAASHSYSDDSAIDADLQEWDTEMLTIDLNGLATNDNLGVELVGGRDDPYYPNDTGIYVSSISKGSVVEGKLKTNDCILRVNNLDCGNVSKRMVIETIRSSGNSCIIMVRRRKIGARSLFTTQLQVNNYDHGLTLETGIYICKIAPGSLAAKEGNLAVGDRVLSINNKPMDGLKYAQEAMAILNKPGDVLTITTLKSTYCSNNCGVGSNRDVYKKYTNSSTQTEVRYGSIRYDERSMYSNVINNSNKQSDMDKTGANVSCNAIVNSSTSGADKWETSSRLKDLNRGRRFLKVDRKYNTNNHHHIHNNNHNNANRNSSPPITFDREKDDAIAELDSVIDSYHSKQQQQQHAVAIDRQNRKSHKDVENNNNGGTWPKARINSMIESVTGTILHPRKHKERLPLSVLLTTSPLPPSSTETFRNATTTGAGDNITIAATTINRTKDDRSCIDFSVKSGNIGKDVLEYYVKKKTGAGKYSDNDNNRPNSSLIVSSCSSSVIGASNAATVAGSHLRAHSGLYSLPPHHYPLTPFVPSSSSCSSNRGGAQILDMRYPSPINVPPSSQSGESLSLTDPPRTYCFEPSYNSLARFHHNHSPSIDSSYHKAKSVIGGSNVRSHPITSAYRSDEIPESYHGFEGGTFPRKKENQRFRIPSNPSVASKSSGGKLSTGSIEKSDRGSPMPTFHVEVLSPGCRQNKRNSLPDYCWPQKPLPGELRRVHIDKSVEPLGIQIQCLDSGGVFVSTVTKHSLASQVGLQVGDQLLEVCGINMRSATYQLAANVLRQCGNSITMLVQYNPDKYNGLSGSEQSSTSGEEDGRSDTRSGSPTPCNSPSINRKSAPPIFDQFQYTHTVTTLTRPKNSDRQDDIKSSTLHEPRYIVLETHKCSNLGISLVGGNAVGIYVHNVAPNSLAANAGLRTGDRILEYNGTDLRRATAEEAAFELAKPADKVTILIQNNLDRYNEVKDKPGDSFYIRAMFDRTGDLGDNLQMQFRKDDILFVDNTMLNGVPGNWRAWLVDQDGYKQQCGVIPSKYKIEEELLLKRSLGDLEGDARRTTRRSFFRRKKHQRSDSKELASFSNINLGWFSDSGSLNEEATLVSYQKVTRLNSEPMLRPVLIVGPLAECVIEKLLADFPDKFVRCISEVKHCSQVVMEKGIADNIFIDYRKKGNSFECTSIASVKDSCGQNSHCILDVSLASVERLHYHRVYPIVLLIKFKSTKQIKEVKDSRYLLDKITAKAAKEMYEYGLKLESEYRHYVSAVIPAGVNLAYMCTQMKAAVDAEQNKTIWVPSSNS